MPEAANPNAIANAPYRPWRLLALLGWGAFLLIYFKRIPGIELSLIPTIAITAGLILFSLFAMPDRRAELLGFSALFAIGFIGTAAGLSMTQKMAMTGVLMMLALGYALWLVRRSSLRLRLLVIGVFLLIAMMEVSMAGVEALAELVIESGG